MVNRTDEDRERQRTIRKLIVERMREIRVEKGMLQREVAEAFGARESYYRGIEAGTKEFSLIRMVRIADALGVHPSELLTLL